RFDIPSGSRGKDSHTCYGIRVPADKAAAGWKIDVDAVVHGPQFWSNPAQTGGSSCAGPDRSNVTPELFNFCVDYGSQGNGDGSVECRLSVPVVVDTATDQPGDIIEGDLNWTDDTLVKIPPNIKEYVLTLKLFDGTSKIITGDANVPPSVVAIST